MKNVPFVGASGQVFNSMLRAANIDRDLCYVGNVINEKLPNNDFRRYDGDLASQLTRLAGELEDVTPTLIVPLGGTALAAFTGNEGITQARGALQRATKVRPGAKLLPTLHPAFVLRQWKFFTVVIGDLIRASEAAKTPEIVWPEKTIYLEPRIEDVRAWKERLLASDILSVDIETGWGFITCIGFAPSSEEGYCIPFVDLRQPNRSYWRECGDEQEAWAIVKEVMESDIPKLGQNFAAYDAYWLLAQMGIRSNALVHDTRILHHSLYPELPKDLAFMGASYTRQGPWKLMRSRNRKDKRDD